jgi:hypothetical protein
MLDYSDFGLYPGLNASLSLYPDSRQAYRYAEFVRPFRGKAPTAEQISAASSAWFAPFSGIVPSLLAQSLSVEQGAIETMGLTGENQTALESILRATAQRLYNTDAFDGLAVCSQYPRKCGGQDGMFADGAYTDGPGLALSIGEYQSLEANDLSKTLKVLLVDSTSASPTTSFSDPSGLGSWMNYFATEQNRGMAPGGYLWPRGSRVPVRSPQIFQEFLGLDNATRLVDPVPGTNYSTLIVAGTTIENSAYGVLAGQAVEMFVVLLTARGSSPVPDVLIGSDLIDRYAGDVADLAYGIAGSQPLLERVRDFFPVHTDSPTPTPTPQTSSRDQSFADRGGRGLRNVCPFLFLTLWAVIR